jgi:hemoglobin
MNNQRSLTTIDSRQDISHLVDVFYSRIRENELLGPIFNSHIPHDKWPAHLSKLTDFWETKLLGIPKFRGNPTEKHVKVDANLDHTVSPKHFEEWVGLWHSTIDEFYEGEIAEKAKFFSERMANAQYTMMLRHRPSNLPT